MSAEERARSLLRLGRHAEAADEARRGLMTDPDDVELLLVLSSSLRVTDPDQAVRPAHRAVTLRPGDPDALLGVAWSEARIGNLPPALKAAEAARDLVPHAPQPYLARARILATNAQLAGKRAGKRYLDDARRDAETARGLIPNEPAVHVLLGEIAMIAGDPALANRYAQEALALDPDGGNALELLGQVAEDGDDIRAAGDYFVRAGRAGSASAADSLLEVGDRDLTPTERSRMIGLALLWILGCLVIAGTVGLGAAQVLFLLGAAIGGIYVYVLAPRRRRLALDTEADRVRRDLKDFPGGDT